MDKLKGFVTALKPQKDYDFVDRIAYYYTVLLLTIFAFIIFGWSFFGTPIQCWFPAYYKGWWQEYALDYCYVQNTYFVKFTEDDKRPQNHWELNKQWKELPTDPDERKKLLIGYYQWVPFVLALMAISFYAPLAIWRSMYGHSGLAVKFLCDQAGNAENVKPEARKGAAAKMASFMDHQVALSALTKRGPIAGRYVTILYIVTKALTTAVCIGQFFMLEHFLGLDESWWGVKVLSDISNNREWTETGHFPRTTMCDYKVRELGNIHGHTVQCVLLINFLNEKIFVFLWFWLLMTAVLSTVSLVYWLVCLIYQNSGRKIVISYLNHIDPTAAKSPSIQRLVSKFLRESLKTDGIFLIRLIGQNCGDLICTDLIEAMWTKFKLRHKDDLKLPMPSAPPVKLAGNPPVAGYSPGSTTPYGFPPLPSYDDVDVRNRGKNESSL